MRINVAPVVLELDLSDRQRELLDHLAATTGVAPDEVIRRLTLAKLKLVQNPLEVNVMRTKILN